MSQRHFQSPGQANPETEHRQKLCRETEVILDEEGSDDAGQAGDTCSHIDHERRQVGEPENLLSLLFQRNVKFTTLPLDKQ